MRLEDYCSFCSARKGNCDFKEHDVALHEFEPFTSEVSCPAICVRCDRIQYADYSSFVGEGAYNSCHTCYLRGDNIERFEDYAAADNTEPSREEVNSTEVVHKAVPDAFSLSENIKHYDDWPPTSLEPSGPKEFISLVNFICSEHGVDPTAQDYREALLLCEALGVEK